MSHVLKQSFCFLLIGLHHDIHRQNIVAYSIMQFLGQTLALILHTIDIGCLFQQFGSLPVEFPAV